MKGQASVLSAPWAAQMPPLLKRTAKKMDLRVLADETIGRYGVMYVQGDGLRAVAAVTCALGNHRCAVADTFSKAESVRNLLRQGGLLLKGAPRKNAFTVFIGGEAAAEAAAACAARLGTALIPALLVMQPSGGDTDFATFIILKALQGESCGEMLVRLSDRRAEFEQDSYVFGSL